MTRIGSISGQFSRSSKLVTDALNGIFAVDSLSVDEKILEEDRLYLLYSSDGNAYKLVLSVGDAFASVSVPSDLSRPVVLTAALPSQSHDKLSRLYYRADGRVTLGDDKTVVSRDTDLAKRNALIAVVVGVQNNLDAAAYKPA